MNTNIRELTPSLGVAVELEGTTDEQQAANVRDLLDRYEVVLLRGKEFEADEQIRLLGSFGVVADERGDGACYSLMTNNRTDVAPLKELDWHADYGYTPFPYTEIALYAAELTGNVSGTRFVSEDRALAALPPALRERVESLDAVSVATAGGSGGVDFESAWDEIANGTYGGVVSRHPAVLVHPRTGKQQLHVTAMFTAGFVDVPFDEGRALLQDLFATLYDPEFMYTHEWRLGDLLVWDNIAVQHARSAVPMASEGGTGVRTLRRVVNSATMAELHDFIPELGKTFGAALAKG